MTLLTTSETPLFVELAPEWGVFGFTGEIVIRMALGSNRSGIMAVRIEPMAALR